MCEKIGTESLGGANYFLTFIDDITHYVWVYALKTKDEVIKYFLEWKTQAGKSSGHQLKVLRTDNGGEYTSKEFENYLKSEGVRHELTIPKTPEQNGVAEHLNQMLVEAMRSMVIDANLPYKFWAEALSTAVYLKNRNPIKAVKDMTPFEAWKNIRPKVGHLRVLDVKLSHTFPRMRGTNLMPKPENVYSLDMEKKLRAIDCMIPQEAESFIVEIPDSMK